MFQIVFQNLLKCFNMCSKNFSQLFQKFLKIVLKVFQEYSDFFQKRLKNASWVLYGVSKVFQRCCMYHGCFKGLFLSITNVNCGGKTYPDYAEIGLGDKMMLYMNPSFFMHHNEWEQCFCSYS